MDEEGQEITLPVLEMETVEMLATCHAWIPAIRLLDPEELLTALSTLSPENCQNLTSVLNIVTQREVYGPSFFLGMNN